MDKLVFNAIVSNRFLLHIPLYLRVIVRFTFDGGKNIPTFILQTMNSDRHKFELGD